MLYKKCTQCGRMLSTPHFYRKSSNPDGFVSSCKECAHSVYKSFRGDPSRFLSKLYSTILYRTNNDFRYKNRDCKFSKEEFIEFSLLKTKFLLLFHNWIKNNYIYALVPSVDRKNNDKGYTLDNIQFLTLSQNCRKAKNRMQTFIKYPELEPVVRGSSFKKCFMVLYDIGLLRYATFEQIKKIGEISNSKKVAITHIATKHKIDHLVEAGVLNLNNGGAYSLGEKAFLYLAQEQYNIEVLKKNCSEN